MTDHDLKERLNAAAAKYQKNFKNNGAADVIRNLSRIISQCQKNGMDVELKSIGYANDLSFQFVKSPQAIQVTAIVKIFDAKHMFCFATKENDEECSKIFLSMHDIHYTDNEDRTWSYDLNEDGITESFDKLQQNIIDRYTYIDALNRYDDFNVLETTKNARYSRKGPATAKTPGASI